jgi:exosortase/archaeosortase family protein
VARTARLSEAQWFGIKFFLILGAASVLSWWVNLPNELGWAQQALAQSAAWLAHLIGSTGSVYQSQIHAGTLAIDINHECTGVYVLIILFTFLLAYPASWRLRLRGAAIGTAAVTGVNIVRISFLIWIAEVAPTLFAYFHEYVWQGVFLVLVIAYAMSWVEGVR